MMSPTGVDAVFGYAPGKVILFGEHAVVYGQPAVAATLDRGVRVAVSHGKDAHGPLLRSNAPGLPPRCKPGPDGEGPERLRDALDRLVELCGARTRELLLTVDAGVPAGAGLGSSAALAVAMLRGVRQFFGESPLATDALIERAFALEQVFHGNPSGVDHGVIATGGCVLFHKTDAGPSLQQLALPRALRLAIGIAGPHAGTAHAVSALRDRMRRHAGHYDVIMNEIGALARSAADALAHGSLASVGELMDLNHGLLNALGVSTPAIEAMVSMARERGALGAKLTGAGGGGAVIALVDDDPATVVRTWQAAGITAFSTTIEQPS
jgi:hydroxymethylglutaryl-CoA reductase